MLLPDFQFSQASLQDYVDCRRRFQLRYLLELAWPAIQTEPAEEQEIHGLQGELFHRLVQQHQRGLPADRLANIARAVDRQMGDSRLTLWWENYLRSPVTLTGRAGPVGLPRHRYPEITLSAPAAGYRLLAKYDLVALEPAVRAAIVDWKTSRVRPGRAWLSARLQTRVYRCIMVEAGAALNEGQPWRPDQVELVYWFANHPDQPERLPYGALEHDADREYLWALISEIAHAGDDDFALTEDVRRCRLCPYRSLCDRGVEAGSVEALAPGSEEAAELEEAMSAWESGFDFEQVAEIAF
jgi:hypothetical protein